MKKLVVSLAALFMTVAASAQTNVNFSKIFGVPTSMSTIDDAFKKGSDGVAFIGDARAAKEETGKAAGLTLQKATKYFIVNGSTVKADASINFVKTPTGIARNGEVLKNKMPSNRAVEIKPTSDGKFQFMVWSKKGACRLYVGVVNNGKYEQKEMLKWEKGATAGTESNPFVPVAYDYKYTEGDIVILFATGPTYLNGIWFSGTTDSSFEGANPKQLTKRAKKSKK